jgi:hypothetical protein
MFNRTSLLEVFEGTKGVIKIANRRTDNTMVKRTRKNNYLQSTPRKTKDRATRTPLKLGVNVHKVL